MATGQDGEEIGAKGIILTDKAGIRILITRPQGKAIIIHDENFIDPASVLNVWSNAEI